MEPRTGLEQELLLWKARLPHPYFLFLTSCVFSHPFFFASWFSPLSCLSVLLLIALTCVLLPSSINSPSFPLSVFGHCFCSAVLCFVVVVLACVPHLFCLICLYLLFRKFVSVLVPFLSFVQDSCFVFCLFLSLWPRPQSNFLVCFFCCCFFFLLLNTESKTDPTVKVLQLNHLHLTWKLLLQRNPPFLRGHTVKPSQRQNTKLISTAWTQWMEPHSRYTPAVSLVSLPFNVWRCEVT